MVAFFYPGYEGLASADGNTDNLRGGVAVQVDDQNHSQKILHNGREKPLRIVILAPAAADIVAKLGLGGYVAGVTSNVTNFPQASTVGTHRNPGIENIAALEPSLIIAPSRFSEEIAARLDAVLFLYEPGSLPDILDAITQLAALTGTTAEGEALVARLGGAIPKRAKGDRPTVVYEVRSTPLSLAAQGSFLANLLDSSGFHYAYKGASGEVSPEYLLEKTPDYYIYQIGPMNRKPVPPVERNGWSGLDTCVWKVDELAFARPNTDSFALANDLAAILESKTPCEAGKAFFARP